MVTTLTEAAGLFLTYIGKATGDGEKRYTQKTQNAYDYELAKFLNWTQQHNTYCFFDVHNIDKSHIEMYLIDRIKGFTVKDGKPVTRETVCRSFSFLKSFFKYLNQNGIILKDPTRSIAINKLLDKCEDNPLRPYLTRDEIRALLAAVTHVQNPLREAVAVHLFAFCGLTLTEAVNLKWLDIVFDYSKQKGVINVLDSQRQQITRTVPFDKNVFHALTELKSVSLEIGWVFVTPDNKTQLSIRQMQKRIRVLGDQAGIKHARVSPATLRNSCAYHLFRKGVREDKVESFLGVTKLPKWLYDIFE